MKKLHVKVGDKVLVLAGKDKGKTATVKTAFNDEMKVIVEGVNIVTKHRKPRSQEDKGGIVKIEAPIDSSNVQIVCKACGKATRVAHKIDENGKKIRICKKCGASLDTTKAKAKAETKKASKEDKKEVATEKVAKKEAKVVKTTKKTTKKEVKE